jgi:serine/threonine protein kinase
MESKPLKDYVIISELGKGGFGVVYKAKRKSDNKVVALKVIHVPKEKLHLIEKTKEEIDTLQTLSVPTCNPFVICYYNSYYNPSVRQFLIEMELVEGQDMEEYANNLWDTKKPEEVYYYLLLIAKDLLNGLKYTHDKGIIHNDIKLENIMIDTNNVPRIIDYGLACNIIGTNDLGKYCVSHGGTVLYIAPEYLTREIRLPATDLWALGIVLYMAATEFQYPFYNVDLRTSNINIILDAISSYVPMKLNTSNQQLNNLVNSLLVKDPSKRLTVDQALAMLSTIRKPAESGNGGFLTPTKPSKPSGAAPLKYEFLTPDQSTPAAVNKRLSKNILIDSMLF